MKINNIELTPELIEKIRDYSPIKIENQFLYVPMVYRALPVEVRPVFTLSYVDGREIVRAEDLMNGSVSYSSTGERKVTVKRGAFALQMCELGIKGWRNYWTLEEQSKEIVFKDATSISALPSEMMHELANAITERRTMSQEEMTGLK
jgi:hypothetical protein